jgi:cytochrome c peroxidase
MSQIESFRVYCVEPRPDRAVAPNAPTMRRAGRWIALLSAMVFAPFALGQGPPPPPPPLPPPQVPPQNPITESKRVLGKLLFWEEQLSSDDTVACGTCHQPFRSISDAREAIHPGFDETFQTPDDVVGSFGVVRHDESGTPVADPLFGFDRQVTPRAAQPIFSALWSPEAFWDGRSGRAFVDPQTGQTVIPTGAALEAQAIVPILSANEMAHEGRTWDDVTGKLTGVKPMALATHLPDDMADAIALNPTYPDLFAEAFGDPAITARRIAFAIATYERTLVPNETPLDLRTLTAQQQRGLNVFLGDASHCTDCHGGPLLTDNTYRTIGLRPIGEDRGRQVVTGIAADAGRFKVPGLRNVGLKATFMHNGRRSTLEEVLDFYLNVGGQQFRLNQDQAIGQIDIPPPARVDLIEFLRNGLTDPRVAEETFPFDKPILRSERGDADRDGDVDGDDRAAFEDCYTGEDAGPVDFGCERLDADGDGDLDCADFTAFVQSWTEPDPPAAFDVCAQAANVPTLSEWGLIAMSLLICIAATVVQIGRRRVAMPPCRRPPLLAGSSASACH